MDNDRTKAFHYASPPYALKPRIFSSLQVTMTTTEIARLSCTMHFVSEGNTTNALTKSPQLTDESATQHAPIAL